MAILSPYLLKPLFEALRDAGVRSVVVVCRFDSEHAFVEDCQWGEVELVDLPQSVASGRELAEAEAALKGEVWSIAASCNWETLLGGIANALLQQIDRPETGGVCDVTFDVPRGAVTVSLTSHQPLYTPQQVRLVLPEAIAALLCRDGTPFTVERSNDGDVWTCTPFQSEGVEEALDNWLCANLEDSTTGALRLESPGVLAGTLTEYSDDLGEPETVLTIWANAEVSHV